MQALCANKPRLEMAGQQSHKAQGLEKTWCRELSIEHRVLSPATLSHPLRGLPVPQSSAWDPAHSTLRSSMATSHPHRRQLPPLCPLQGLESTLRRALSSCGRPAGPLAQACRGVPRGKCLLQPQPSSRLQLPGEAGQLPLVVDDLQLLDIGPGAGRTPGA